MAPRIPPKTDLIDDWFMVDPTENESGNNNHPTQKEQEVDKLGQKNINQSSIWLNLHSNQADLMETADLNIASSDPADPLIDLSPVPANSCRKKPNPPNMSGIDIENPAPPFLAAKRPYSKNRVNANADIDCRNLEEKVTSCCMWLWASRDKKKTPRD